MTFTEWLFEEYGVTWSYWDDNFSPLEQDRIYAEYCEYCEMSE